MSREEEMQNAIDKVWRALGPKVMCPCGNTPEADHDCLIGLSVEANAALDAIRPYVSDQNSK